MSAKISLSSLAIDLKRVANGYWFGSKQTTERFWAEALMRKKEIDSKSVEPYVSSLLDEFSKIYSIQDEKEKAESALMYSILFQNAALKLK